VADASVLIDPVTSIASVDASVPTTIRSPNAGTVASAWNTVQSFREDLVTGKQAGNRVPRYSANLFTDYTFRSGPLKDVRIGGGVNYRGRQGIAYRGSDTIVDPSNPAVAIDDPKVDAYDVLYIPAYTTATAVLGYNLKLSKKLRMQVTLKIDNLFDYDKPIYTGSVLRPPGGDITSPARVATPTFFTWVKPRQITLSTALRF
jgi:outer membrane receptor for ferric coprogen and ferric-rhodotorulic acid